MKRRRSCSANGFKRKGIRSCSGNLNHCGERLGGDFDYTPDTDYYWRQMESRMLRKDEKPKSVPLWKFWMAVSVATVLLVLSLTFSFLYNKTEYWTDSSCKLSYSSLSGKSKIILPDSSVVWLNSGSSLRYAVNFFENREVDLSGEALFDVTKDSRHPFVVSTSGVKVRVHGTRFNVNSYSKEENILVTLFQGSVSLEAGGKRLICIRASEPP